MKKLLLPPCLPILAVLLYAAGFEFISANWPEVLSNDCNNKNYTWIVYGLLVSTMYPPLVITNQLYQIVSGFIPVRFRFISILVVGGILGLGLCIYARTMDFSGLIPYAVCITLAITATAAMAWCRTWIANVGIKNQPNKTRHSNPH